MPRRRLRAVAAAGDRLDHATARGVLVFLVILLDFDAAAVGLLPSIRRPFVVASQAAVRWTGGSPWTAEPAASGVLPLTAAVDGPLMSYAGGHR